LTSSRDRDLQALASGIVLGVQGKDPLKGPSGRLEIATFCEQYFAENEVG
jgi:hypothetical protein